MNNSRGKWLVIICNLIETILITNELMRVINFCGANCKNGVVELSPKVTLTEVTRELGLPNPVYGTDYDERQYIESYVELVISRGDQPHETIRRIRSSGVRQ